ncbi:DKNYY domain-containing protein [Dyadobacter sp. CY326]|uniref:DKNYY domain-containing protein n=1 Tax=Dyadobacter sp. CY326 TaxID=2907300 RepID=UPI001F468B5A|nr:DKNYY domain-containing protein [Dyadobacter sp. CY326]MCE7064775.1 DKNYY domain-containing protein [Dyadobacter sp. CY326]
MADHKHLKSKLIIMGLLGILANLFYCADNKSGFKPGVLTARGYYVENGKAYFYGGFSNASVIELKEANAEKFEAFDKRFPGNVNASEYAGDDKVVYYLGSLLKDADSETFEVLDFGLGKDANHVYSRHNVISDDAAHFVKIDGGLFKDSQHVYSGDQIVSDDPNNIKYLGEFGYIKYFSDSKGILANKIRIDSVDVQSFKPLEHGYAIDHSQVFIIQDARLEKVENAHTPSFEVISRFYSKDASSVFWRGDKLPGANPATFKIISEEHHCSCDDKKVYHQNKVVPNADPAKFPVGKKFKYCNDSEIVFE